MSEKKAQPKFNPQRELAKAVKEAPNPNYAVELLLDEADAEAFKYLSEWVVNEKKYRVVARLKKDGKILVQALFVP